MYLPRVPCKLCEQCLLLFYVTYRGSRRPLTTIKTNISLKMKVCVNMDDSRCNILSFFSVLKPAQENDKMHDTRHCYTMQFWN